MKKNYGYLFVFESGNVDTRKVISVKAQDQPVDAVVKQILYGQEVSYEIKEKNIIVRKTVSAQAQFVNQQTKTITGIVSDDTGEPVIGANVVEKGVTNGTVTDADGKFSLTISENATLQVSFIGYITQEISVLAGGWGKPLVIKLIEDSQALEEVVVIGYGSIKKSDLTGSISTLKSDAISLGSSNSPDQALRGKTSGVQITATSGQPGAGAVVRIRGTSSILGSNNPLYVIDGI
ncbi:MAG: carboxypeptidase-like regulatory domain-containing protein, partial [Tannerella sp.]|nr:carboxypeptidase-like regulatory domain-containing protein [Tannerella sp.]